MNAPPHALREKPTLGMVGLLLVTMVIGYEWFISGLVKFVRGGFPAGLADELLEKSAGTADWYAGFLQSVVIPNADLFGYLIEISELLAGIVLIAGPAIWLLAWDWVPDWVRATTLWLTALAALGGAFLAINLHLANGAAHPWFIPGDAFDEGVDLDSVLPAIQIVIATVSIVFARRLRRDRADGGRSNPVVAEPPAHGGDLHDARTPIRFLRGGMTASLLWMAVSGVSGTFWRAEAQAPAATAAREEDEAEVPHPFFTHMGIPEGVGVWNLRSAGLATRAEGKTEGDFAFHLETGITERIGLHVRNDRFLDVPQSEAMFQFAAIMSENGMSGFAPLIEFEIPTRSGGGSRVNTLVGFTTALANSRVSFNQVIHYDPREDMTDASASLVVGITERIFPVVEVLTEIGRGVRPIANVLGGVKVRVREGIVLGLAYQLPVTSNEEFSWQLVGMPEVEWRW